MLRQGKCRTCGGTGTVRNPTPTDPHATAPCLKCSATGSLTQAVSSKKRGGPSSSGQEAGCGCMLVLAVAALIYFAKGPGQPEGTIEILRFGDYYCYHDTKFGKGRRALPAQLWVYSLTPPDADVKEVEETLTFYSLRGNRFRVISEGRMIPRSHLYPVQKGLQSVTIYGNEYQAKTHYYKPPENASDQEQRMLRKRWQ